MKNTKLRFPILVALIIISGLSQGMLLPLIAIILENRGVSSTVNGLHATGLYLGVLLASPFMEAPLRKFGYKPLIITGGLIVIISLFLFPFLNTVMIWFILRLLVGIGDHILHFSTQTWITSFSPPEKRGRNISLYGLSFGIGFAVGPLLTRLVDINENLPFYATAFFSLLAWLTVFLLQNEYPDQINNDMEPVNIRSTIGRFGKVLKFAWAPLLPALCYGVLEASLNGNFPVYGLRLGFDVHLIAVIISAFSIGAIIFQLPLGLASDRFGRRNVLLFAMLIGSVTFLSAGIFEHSAYFLLAAFFIAGMLLGSTYSLSIAFLTDTIPKHLLPAGNLLISICFSLGSISGPFLGGLAIEHLPNISFFFLISCILFLIFFGLAGFKEEKQLPLTDQRWNF